MPALLVRFFSGMRDVFTNVQRSMKPGAHAFVVMGDNLTSAGSTQIRIPTTDFMSEIGLASGLELVEEIPITVTTENLAHMKNAIRENRILRFRAAGGTPISTRNGAPATGRQTA
jgi:hypothetical protein